MKEYEDPIRAGISVFRTYVESWYSGELQKVFYTKNIDPIMKKQICSVLAGYVWDESNPFVTKHSRILTTLAKVVTINERNES